MRLVALAVVALALPLAGCGGTGPDGAASPAGAPADGAGQQTLTVLAAASLTDALIAKIKG